MRQGAMVQVVILTVIGGLTLGDIMGIDSNAAGTGMEWEECEVYNSMVRCLTQGWEQRVYTCRLQASRGKGGRDPGQKG